MVVGKKDWRVLEEDNAFHSLPDFDNKIHLLHMNCPCKPLVVTGRSTNNGFVIFTKPIVEHNIHGTTPIGSYLEYELSTPQKEKN